MHAEHSRCDADEVDVLFNSHVSGRAALMDPAVPRFHPL
jgi:hypothetical protein